MAVFTYSYARKPNFSVVQLRFNLAVVHSQAKMVRIRLCIKGSRLFRKGDARTK